MKGTAYFVKNPSKLSNLVWENEMVDLSIYQQYWPDPELHQANYR